MNKGDGLASGAKHLKAVVTLAAAESGGERVVVDESSRKRGGDDVRGWVMVSGGGVKVGAEVTKGESEVGVGVEVGEREDMVLMEGWCGGGHVGGLCDFDLHCWKAIGFRLLIQVQGLRCFDRGLLCRPAGCGDLWVLVDSYGQSVTVSPNLQI